MSADSKTFHPHGKHLIAGEWVGGGETFANSPATGESDQFQSGTPAHVNQACEAAEDAFWSYASSSRESRADFLDAIADEMEARAEIITEVGARESGLPTARLQGERGRTMGQLRLFADHIRKGAHLDRRVDGALPERQPMPRPDIRMIQRPIGPVAVFGASNFPLAFSTAGGDTASALAAGCTVVVKGHPAHPGTGEIVAAAIDAAIRRCGMPAGTFNLIHGDTHEVGQALVRHPLIKAVGFTGSLGAGRALYDLCAARPEPIPFFGELGSVNPMFMLPQAMAVRGGELAKGWAGSLTMGAGQFCTNPGIAVVRQDQAGEFADATLAALRETGAQVMLTQGIAAAYAKGADTIRDQPGARDLLTQTCDDRRALPRLYMVTGDDWQANHALSEEVFGPLGLIVTATDDDQMVALARSLAGQLTATLHMDAGDAELGRQLLPVLERKAGRILANGFPTGVEVADAMVHSGPWPASTNFGATSVGTLAIRRFLRPVCFQNIPAAIMPEDIAG